MAEMHHSEQGRILRVVRTDKWIVLQKEGRSREQYGASTMAVPTWKTVELFTPEQARRIASELIAAADKIDKRL